MSVSDKIKKIAQRRKEIRDYSDKEKLQSLRIRQALSLELKIKYSEQRIRDWYYYWHGKVCINFSGGKDSTVLLHLVRSIFSEVPAVFVDTGLEYPEIREFVKTIDSVVWLKPKMTFKQVIKKYGYPLISKKVSAALYRYERTTDSLQKYYRLAGYPGGNKGKIPDKWQFLTDTPFKISEKCCDILKIEPLIKYQKKNNRYPFIGQLVEESDSRKYRYLQQGCNSFNVKYPVSWPIAFWTTKDIWEYIKKFNVPYSKIYAMGEDRTGCMFCMFGVHNEKEPNRFQRMKIFHSKHWDLCINKMNLRQCLDFIGVPYE